MKAVIVRQFGPFSQAQVEDVADPTPGPDEVIIAVEAVDVNYPDLLMMEGRYQVKPTLPFIPGKGAAGRITAVGDRVADFVVGQSVAVQVEHGAYAEKAAAPAAWCYPVPVGLEPAIAAAGILAYQTAWFALTDRASLSPGESVLVLGAGGGVGVASIQLARALGAGLVIGATRGAGKAELIREAGADHVVDLDVPNLKEGLRAQVHALTGGRGVDIVIDPVGGAAFEPALRALAWRGRLVVVGFVGGEIPAARANYLLVRNIAVAGVQSSDYRNRWPLQCAEAQAAIFRYMQRGDLRPHLGARYPFSRFAEALVALRDGQARGKLILIPDAFWTQE